MPASSRLSATGRVRWRRFAILLLPAAAFAGLLMGLTAEGAIAASISVPSREFLVTADRLTGSGYEQFPCSQHAEPVIVSAIHSATLTNLCQSVSFLGITLRLTAGGNGNPVFASDLIMDAGSMTAGTFTLPDLSLSFGGRC